MRKRVVEWRIIEGGIVRTDIITSRKDDVGPIPGDVWDNKA